MANKPEPTNVPSANDAEIERALLEVLKRSAVDPEFRRLALRDSRTAINQINSKLLLEGLEVRFVEGSTAVTTRTVMLNVALPDPVSSTLELTEAELQEVAGGKPTGANMWCVCTGCCITSIKIG
ncbi:MAG TPA: hypothetical protein VMW38_15795 [Terriglobia bacterium]|nr:hypothetical protein [Terriglobia bacterium]